MITMSHKEIDRLKIIQQLSERHISQTKVAEQLNISTRQVRRLAKQFHAEGAKGLISKRRGRGSNNKLPASTKSQALELIRQYYPDFGPTFAHEKLTEQHKLNLSVETLRQWVTHAQVWQPKSVKRNVVHQSRPRRSQRGELTQIDGSPHDWLEERAEVCNLTVFIDDASDELMSLLFTPTEATQTYMEALDSHLDYHGRPVAFYNDKHAVCKVNHPDH